MSKVVIWLAGGHRSGSNFLGCFLMKCGAETCAKVKPDPSEWNAEYSDDPWILCHTSYVMGVSEVAGLPNPETPSKLETSQLLEMEQYVKDRFNETKGPYLLKSNVAGGLYSVLLPAFPLDTRHILISNKRNQQSQINSLAARTRLSIEICKNYLDRIEITQKTMEDYFLHRNWSVFKVSFDDLQLDPVTYLNTIVLTCGLTVTQEALTVFKQEQVRF